MDKIDMEYTFQLSAPDFELRFTDSDPFFKAQHMLVSVRELIVTTELEDYPQNVYRIVCKNKSNLVLDPREGLKSRYCNLAVFSIKDQELHKPKLYALHSTPMKVSTTTGKLSFELSHLEGARFEFSKFKSIWIRIGLKYVSH